MERLNFKAKVKQQFLLDVVFSYLGAPLKSRLSCRSGQEWTRTDFTWIRLNCCILSHNRKFIKNLNSNAGYCQSTSTISSTYPQPLLALCLALQRNVETFLPCNAQYLVALPLEMPYLLYQIILKPFQFPFKPR